MSKHTPGPWVIGEINHKKQRVNIDTRARDDRLGYTAWAGLARTYGCEGDKKIGSKVMVANARLIAAAPELLEALKGMIEQFWIAGSESEFDAIQKAREAIAKAEGKQ